MKNPTPKFSGEIKDGKLYFTDRNIVDEYLKTLSGKVSIVIKKKKETRSTKQNNYYWAYLTIIQNETGELAEELHELFKRIFLKPEDHVILGRKIVLPSSTTNLDTHEFTEFIAKIELLTQIPSPDPDSIEI